jgi:hypothetical protein
MGLINRVEQREPHFNSLSLSTLTKGAGLSIFSGIAARMVQLLHGQIDTYTRIECVLARVNMSRIRWLIGSGCRSGVFLSCSIASEARNNVRSIPIRFSMSSKPQLFGITVRSLLRTLNIRHVSEDRFVVPWAVYVPRCRPVGDWRYRAIQGSS